MASCLGKLKHLGVNNPPKRSTLSYANEHRPWQLYQRVFYQLLDKCTTLARGKKRFRFKNKLFSLDATVIELCAKLFNWARFRTTKDAVKLHLLLGREGYLPVFANITEGKVHEVNIARGLSFPNALMIQIWTALIAILALKYIKFRSKFGWSLSNLVAMLRYNLFAYRDLWEWIDNPYEQPPIAADIKQLLLGFV